MKKNNLLYTIIGIIIVLIAIIAIWYSSAKNNVNIATNAGDGVASTTVSDTESEATNLQGLE